MTSDVSDPAQSRASVVTGEFRTIFTDNYSYVFHSLRRLGVREADLPDLTHEVFMAVHQRFATFDQARPLRPWLFGIAFRSASNYRRLARHGREQSGDAFDAIDRTPLVDDQISTRQAQELVLRALDSLDEEKRAVFVMHEIDEQAVPLIAETLQIPLNTAYSRLRAARATFAEALTREKARVK
jgi:RNA polymerase sigma-70 factor (ECF subfamily)